MNWVIELLGTGRVDGSFTIKVKRISQSAKEKINQAGGEVLILNGTTQGTGIFRTIVKKVSPAIPQIEKPKKKVNLRNKLIWTGIALLIYFVMGQVPLFGIVLILMHLIH